MRRLPLLALALLAALGGWSLAGGALAEGPTQTLKPEARVTFEDLGWTEDVILTRENPSAAVEFVLPSDAAQGESPWYGLKLSYEWEGNLSLEQPVYVYALWNGQSLYQLKVKRDQTLFPQGQAWSMVDSVQGGGGGIEYGTTIRAASTNYATFSTVQPGLNRLEVQLDTAYAPDANTSVRIHRSSTVLVTDWGPADLRIKGTADIQPNRIDLHFAAKNHGIGTPPVAAQAVVVYADGSQQREEIPAPARIGPLETWHAEHSIDLESPDVTSVYVLLNWGTGRTYQLLWPQDSQAAWKRLPIWSLPGAIVAIVVLWIAVPASVRGVRADRGRPGASPSRSGY